MKSLKTADASFVVSLGMGGGWDAIAPCNRTSTNHFVAVKKVATQLNVVR
ncbi:MAG: hypothetical protein AB1589_06735 [Cyanobacteriota bacterium]